MKKSRANKKFNYTITLYFNFKTTTKIWSGLIEYKKNGVRKDNVLIRKNCIEIKGIRNLNTHVASFESMKASFSNKANNTFYKQVTKCLCIYYLLMKSPKQITSIEISNSDLEKINKRYVWKANKIQQAVLEKSILKRIPKICDQSLARIIQEDDKARGCLNAAIYYIKSMDAKTVQERFEKLWQAFNALYKVLANKTSDHECHVKLRTYMLDNPLEFGASSLICDSITVKEIRANTRWIKMIQNNYNTPRQMKSLKECIDRKKDYRLGKVYYDILPVREKKLKNAGLYNAVCTQLNKILADNVKNNIDLASTLVLSYGYYLRNKMIHAEKVDLGFSVFQESEEHKQTEWMSQILECVVADLLNICYKF